MTSITLTISTNGLYLL